MGGEPLRIKVNGRRGRMRSALVTGVGGCLVCALAVAVPADAATTGPVPTLDCIAVNGSVVTAYFGYTNTGPNVAVPFGTSNQVVPGIQFQGQPTVFNVGAFPRVFFATFSSTAFTGLAWELNGGSAIATLTSPRCAPGTTAPASGVSSTAATLNGVVTPGGTDTSYTFEYGTTPAYGTTTAVTDGGSGDAGELVQAALTGLSPSQTYYFRLDTTASYGADTQGNMFSQTSDGAQQSFTTPAAPVVTPPPPPAGMTLGTTSLPAGKAGVPYSAALSATGGTQPYTWLADDRALPDGLRLNGKTGVISGKPREHGTFQVTISVTDSAAPARESLTERYSITIAR